MVSKTCTELRNTGFVNGHDWSRVKMFSHRASRGAAEPKLCNNTGYFLHLGTNQQTPNPRTVVASTGTTQQKRQTDISAQGTFFTTRQSFFTLFLVTFIGILLKMPQRKWAIKLSSSAADSLADAVIQVCTELWKPGAYV